MGKSKPNPRQSNSYRRREAVKQVKREEDVCGLCGHVVDKSLPPYLDGSPEVDEIVSIAAGGSPYVRSNLQLTHRLCNQRKGSGLAARSAPGELPMPTSQAW